MLVSYGPEVLVKIVVEAVESIVAFPEVIEPVTIMLLTSNTVVT